MAVSVHIRAYLCWLHLASAIGETVVHLEYIDLALFREVKVDHSHNLGRMLVPLLPLSVDGLCLYVTGTHFVSRGV